MGEVHTPPDRIWAWEIDHEDMPPNGYYATAEVDDSTPYLRATPAREAAEDLVEALEFWLELAAHCSIEEGVCCCGDNMENHSSPMDCGHSPVDHGAYVATQLIERTRAALARAKGGAA